MTDKSIIASVIALVIGTVLGIFLGASLNSQAWRVEAISLGYGQYNSTNANFQWKIEK